MLPNDSGMSIGSQRFLSSNDKAIADLTDEVRRLSEKVEALNKTLTGNGEPMESVVVRLALLERGAFLRTIISVVSMIGIVVVVIYLVLLQVTR